MRREVILKMSPTKKGEGSSVDPIEEVTAVAQRPSNTLQGLDDKYFEQNANIGLEDLDPEDMPTPTLTLIQRTSKVVDSSGRPYMPGTFYYKATKQNLPEVKASILVFTKQESPSYNDKNVMERVYVFLGAIMPELQPFKMFLRSSGIGAAKQFLGEVKALKKPMYALDVEIFSVKRENEFGPYYVPQFNINGIRQSAEEIVLLEDLARTYSDNRHRISEESVQEATAVADDMPFA